MRYMQLLRAVQPGHIPQRQGSRWHIIAAFALMAALGCRQLTGIDAPDLVDPSALDNATGAAVRYAGAISDFAVGYSGQVAETGLITDELQDLDNNAYSSDRRHILPTNRYPFGDMSRARISALRAIRTLQSAAPTPSQRIGELYALVGFVEVMFDEDMCAPIPLASVVDGTPASAPPFSRDQLISHAMAMFDSAAMSAGGSDTVLSLASVGRARALLLSGDLQAAAAAVASVPVGFEYPVVYSASTSGLANIVYESIAVDRYTSVSDREGINGLPFLSGSDPRIGAQDLGLSRSGLPLYNFAKNAGLDAPIILASGVEAALIRAEASLEAGETEIWEEILNELRQTAAHPSVPPLPSDSTTAADADLRLDVLFHERAFWLFGTGHRQGDMRRLIAQYGRAPEETFPTGEYAPAPGASYGTSVAFSPSGEEPNLAYDGCTESAQ